MKIDIRFSERSRKELQQLPIVIQEHIVQKLEKLKNASNPFIDTKSLTGKLKGLYRLRVGDYRLIYHITKTGSVRILLILSIRHRKDAYRSS